MLYSEQPTLFTAQSNDYNLVHKVQKNKKILILNTIAKSKKNFFKNLKADNFPVPSPKCYSSFDTPSTKISETSTAIGSPMIGSDTFSSKNSLFNFSNIDEVIDEMKIEEPVTACNDNNTSCKLLNVDASSQLENTTKISQSCMGKINFFEAPTENIPTNKLRRSCDGKTNELLLMKIAEVEEGIKMQCTSEQIKNISETIDQLVEIYAKEKETLLRISTDSLVCSILLIACTKAAISKHIFLKVLSEKINRKTGINISKIKGTLCYTLIKRKFVEQN